MKSKFVAFLLWFFFGFFSVHRFYLGKIGSGIFYLLTGQLFGIGWFIDLFLLSGMVESYNTREELKTIRASTNAMLKNNLSN
jgi:TM2 domain-containing membrane protein YozV